MVDYKSGDLFGFSGTGHKESLLIRARDLTKWSHVGIACEFRGEVLLWESTTLSNIPCSICGDKHAGVQAVPIEDRIAAYNGRVWVARIRESLDDPELFDGIEFLMGEHGKPYDRKQVLWAIPSLGIYRGQRYDDSAWFCSELSVEFYKRAERMDRDVTPAAWRPCHVMRRLPRWGTTYRPERLK